MAQKITDLSDLLSDDKHVRLRKAGTVYTLPGDIPAELFLRIQLEAERQDQQVAAGEMPDNREVVTVLREQILELFRYGTPELEQLPPELTLPQLIGLIARVYGDAPDPEPDGPRPTKAGTRSTKPQPRKRSRS